MKFGQGVNTLLAGYGVDTVFGIPGVHTLELFRGMSAVGIDAVVPRHEQGAGFMADGYSRVSGRPGICYLVSGPGVFNALTPIAQAWHDSVPMLVVASCEPIEGRRPGRLHSVPDQVGALAGVTSTSEEITDPDRFAECVADAFDGWATGRPRPVHLAVPADVLSREVGTISMVRRPSPTRPALCRSAMRRAADLLAGSRRPVMIIGGGANHAVSEVRELAEALGAPVVTTGNARGLLAPHLPLALDTTLPFAPVQELIANSDVVIAVGTELSDVDVLFTGSQVSINGSVVRIDIDRDQLDMGVPAAAGLHADAASACSALAAELRSSSHVPAPSGAARVEAALAALRSGPTLTQYDPWLQALGAALPDNAVVAVDSTQLAYEAHHFVPVRRPRSWLAPYGLGTLGPALPMAIGAAVAEPARPVVAIAGDGGALFTIAELATAVSLRRQLTFVVWDNGGYGEIRRAFDAAAIPRVGTETSAHDLTAIAAGFGARAHRVNTPSEFAKRLRESTTYDKVTVLVVDAPDSVRAATGT